VYPAVRKQRLQAFDRGLRARPNLLQKPVALRFQNRFAVAACLASAR